MAPKVDFHSHYSAPNRASRCYFLLFSVFFGFFLAKKTKILLF